VNDSSRPQKGPRGPRKPQGSGAGPRPYKPRGEGRPGPQGASGGRSYRSRDEGAAPRSYRPRGEGAPAGRTFRSRDEGAAGPRPSFRPRGEGAPRAGRAYPQGPSGERPRTFPGRAGGAARPRDDRGAAPRSYRPREEGAAPRSYRPREEGAAPRSYRPRGEGAPSARPFRSRDDAGSAPRPSFRPRREEGGAGSRPSYRPREEGAAPRTFRPRTEGAPSARPYRSREEGGAGARPSFRPRREEGGAGPRPSDRSRDEGAAPRSYRPRAEGAAPRTYRPREEGAAPRSYRPRSEGAPSARPYRSRDEGGAGARPSFRPRREEGAAGARPSYRPRPEGAPGARPRFERSGPRPERSGPPRGDRPFRELPPSAGPESRFDRGQEGAVNRSRPVYERDSRVRWRRDGRPSPATPPAWKARREQGTSAPPEDLPRHAPRGPRATAFEDSAPSLPSDPREAALRILHAVDTRSAFSDRLLDSAHQQAGDDPRDRALLHELVKGTLRWRGRLDWALDQRVHIGLQAVQPWIRNVLRLGAYQVLMLDRIPPHAAVDESVKLAHKYGHPGAAGLVNSVLRRLTEEKDKLAWPEGDDIESLCVYGSHPHWMVERWLARFGPEETRALLLADNRSVPTGLRANTLRVTREQLVEKLAAEGVEARLADLSPDLVWVEGHQSPGNLKAFKEGLCTAQDESEALVGRVVAPQQHERLLDLCAAPGGKSTHLAELIGDEGEVWAMERDAHRVASLEAAIARLGQHSIHVVHGDGTSYAFPMPFDRALVDAPCSGLGVLARRADARWRKGPGMFDELPPVQLELLEAAARRLRPGGTLVYSVCTFEPEETDDVIAKFLAAHPEFTVESVAGSVPDAVVTPEGFMRVLPQRHGCDGAFAARMRRA
jgi:16S rRNA (cytosine967-C5)-methyltransferase